MKQYGRSGFFQDFSIGCAALVLLGILIFVLVPLIIIGFQIALWLAVPVAALILIVLFVALFGRFVSNAGKYWWKK